MNKHYIFICIVIVYMILTGILSIFLTGGGYLGLAAWFGFTAIWILFLGKTVAKLLFRNSK